MPSELFGDVAAHRPGPRSRSSSLLICSALGHIAIFLLIIVVSLRAIGPLPDPRSAIASLVPTHVVEIKDPPRPVEPKRTPAADTVAQVSSLAPLDQIDNRPIAPVEAADTIAPESGDLPRTEGKGAGTNTPDGPPIAIEPFGKNGNGTGIGPMQLVAPPPTPQRTAQRLRPGIREPKKIASATPIYPMVAQAARIQGTVILEITVGTNGIVENVDVLRSIPMLDQAAIDAVRRWKYEPAQLNGTPIPVIITVTVNFALDR